MVCEAQIGSGSASYYYIAWAFGYKQWNPSLKAGQRVHWVVWVDCMDWKCRFADLRWDNIPPRTPHLYYWALSSTWLLRVTGTLLCFVPLLSKMASQGYTSNSQAQALVCRSLGRQAWIVGRGSQHLGAPFFPLQSLRELCVSHTAGVPGVLASLSPLLMPQLPWSWNSCKQPCCISYFSFGMENN